MKEVYKMWKYLTFKFSTNMVYTNISKKVKKNSEVQISQPLESSSMNMEHIKTNISIEHISEKKVHTFRIIKVWK
jgi:hypothetical protein